MTSPSLPIISFTPCPPSPNTHPNYLFIGSHTLRHYALCPNHPGPSTRQLGMAPTHQIPMKLFKPVTSQPTHPALPALFCRNHNEGSCQSSPPTSATLQTPVFPLVPPMVWHAPFFLGTNKLCFTGQSSPNLLVLLYLKFSINIQCLALSRYSINICWMNVSNEIKLLEDCRVSVI